LSKKLNSKFINALTPDLKLNYAAAISAEKGFYVRSGASR
jgi:hypothetical protein